MLHGRYDLRAGFLALSMGLRLAGIAVGAPHGLVWAIAGIAVGQAIATLGIAVVGVRFFRRFPSAAPVALGTDRREILRFIAQSTGATGMLSLRAPISPMLLAMVTTVPQVAYFRVAQAPQQGFNAVSAPVRLVLLAEQTRDWERGDRERVFAGIRRYTVLATVGCAVLLPVLLVFMGPIVRLLFSPKNSGAIGAARIIVVAGAVQFVVGWSKSFAVTCGRPQLRIWTYGVETLVLVPLLVVLGLKWGAVGAAFAVLASSVAFALSWLVLYRRIRRAPPPEPDTAPAEVAALTELGALL
jgi:O-antigen/teichoic acid export membrane protein